MLKGHVGLSEAHSPSDINWIGKKQIDNRAFMDYNSGKYLMN